MAFVPIAPVTDLETVKATIRSQSATLNAQHTEVLSLQLTDIVHLSVQFVRNFAGKVLDQFYSTSVAVTEATNLINISTLDISDIHRMFLNDATQGRVAILSETKFYSIQQLYTAAQLADAIFAMISNVLDTDTRMSIRTFRGTNRTTVGTLTLVYPRNPTKAAADTSKLDIPESYIPIVIDVATVMVFRKVNQKPPSEVEGRVMSFTQAQAQGIGVKISPSQG